MRVITLMILGLFLTHNLAFGQCCAGGTGSPVAGGTSQGVLSAQQIELNTNFQFINSDKFFTGDNEASEKYFDSFESAYQYFRLAYGVTSNFTFSVETGNYFYKREIGLNNDATRTYESSGIGDLVIFPRYTILNACKEKTTTEITLGMGYKIPLGTYNDSTGFVEPFSGNTFYVTNPQSVQVTSGAQDVIFYAFAFRKFNKHNFRIFANSLYVKKGWNPLGEKLGDFASVGLFAGKTFFEHYGLTFQFRYEWMDQMKINKNILLYAFPSYDPEATGYEKVFFTPQVNFNKGKFTLYMLADIPVYQYVTKTQVGTELQLMAGLSFRFFASDRGLGKIKAGEFYCPMHLDVVSKEQGSCTKCGMDLIRK